MSEQVVQCSDTRWGAKGQNWEDGSAEITTDLPHRRNALAASFILISVIFTYAFNIFVRSDVC